jgi:hypothetical protein
MMVAAAAAAVVVVVVMVTAPAVVVVVVVVVVMVVVAVAAVVVVVVVVAVVAAVTAAAPRNLGSRGRLSRRSCRRLSDRVHQLGCGVPSALTLVPRLVSSCRWSEVRSRLLIATRCSRQQTTSMSPSPSRSTCLQRRVI